MSERKKAIYILLGYFCYAHTHRKLRLTTGAFIEVNTGTIYNGSDYA